MTQRGMICLALLVACLATPAGATTESNQGAVPEGAASRSRKAAAPARATTRAKRTAGPADAAAAPARATTRAKRTAGPADAAGDPKPPAAPAPGRPGAAPRRLEDIHIEGEIPAPQVLFITARDQRRFTQFHHRRYLKSSLEVGQETHLPAHIALTGNAATQPGRQ